MKLSQESKDKIRKAYIGDLHWLNTIREELEKYEEQDWEEPATLICTLISMNGVIIDTETFGFLGKYNTQAQDLYSEMKIDLTKMIGYEEMWEEL